MCVVLDVLHTNILFAGKPVPIAKNKTLAMRLTCLVFYALCLLYFRWWIMDFEGPTFTAIDNPAAYSENLFSKVCYNQ